MFKSAKVVLLPTNQKVENCGIGIDRKTDKGYPMTRKYMGNKYFDTDDGSPEHNSVFPYHLYFVTEDLAKEGCVGYNETYSLVLVDENYNRFSKAYEIVATTDPTLSLPKPSTGFIEKFCEANDIDTVKIEYILQHDLQINIREKELSYIPKVKDGVITIRPVKLTWSTSEIKNLLEKFADEVDNRYRPYTTDNSQATEYVAEFVKKSL